MIVEKRLGGEYGRDYIENMSDDDRRHNINSCGTLARDNAYGEIVSINEETGEELPVICGHGGSMWLCRKCKDDVLLEEEKKAKEEMVV